MHFTLLALPTLFLSALAAPTPTLDLSAANGIVSEIESVVPSLSAKPHVESLLNTTDLTGGDLTVPTLSEKRQAQSLLDTLNDLLDTISPIAREIEYQVGDLANTDAVIEGTQALLDLEGLLTQLVIAIENVAGSISKAASGGKEVDDIMRHILKKMDGVEDDLKDVANVDAIDKEIGKLNDALSHLINEGGDALDGVLDGLNDALDGSSLKDLKLGGLL